MSVLIKGMEKPEHCGYCRFRYDGICHALQKTQYSMNECPLVVIDDAGLNDTISRQAAIKYLMTNMNWYDEDGYESDDDYKRECITELINGVPSAQPEQRYTEEELRVFAHGISLSLLSKRSSQHWQYDKDTATEIEFLERLYDKVSADMTGGQG